MNRRRTSKKQLCDKRRKKTPLTRSAELNIGRILPQAKNTQNVVQLRTRDGLTSKTGPGVRLRYYEAQYSQHERWKEQPFTIIDKRLH